MVSLAERATCFGAIAADYDRLRPRPPEAAVDWLLPGRCELAVDLAAGTGLLTRALARKVPRVVAVEPDARMRAVLKARSPEVRVVEGVGEAIPMPDASADGVFISSAWHWMDPERAVPEIARVLRDGRRFGMIWTRLDRAADWIGDIDRFRETGQFARPVTAEPPGRGGPHGAARGDADGAHNDARGDADGAHNDAQGDADGAQGDAHPRVRRYDVTLPDAGLFRDIETQSFAFTRAMTIPDIIDMLGTYSGVITASPQDRSAGLACARAILAERFPGSSVIDVPMRTWCWRADRADRAG